MQVCERMWQLLVVYLVPDKHYRSLCAEMCSNVRQSSLPVAQMFGKPVELGFAQGCQLIGDVFQGVPCSKATMFTYCCLDCALRTSPMPLQSWSCFAWWPLLHIFGVMDLQELQSHQQQYSRASAATVACPVGLTKWFLKIEPATKSPLPTHITTIYSKWWATVARQYYLSIPFSFFRVTAWKCYSDAPTARSCITTVEPVRRLLSLFLFRYALDAQCLAPVVCVRGGLKQHPLAHI